MVSFAMIAQLGCLVVRPKVFPVMDTPRKGPWSFSEKLIVQPPPSRKFPVISTSEIVPWSWANWIPELTAPVIVLLRNR